VSLSLGGGAPKAKSKLNMASIIDSSDDAIIVNTVIPQPRPGTGKASKDKVPRREAATISTPASTAIATPAACMLCKRQFPSQEMLIRHEKESKLHADNLRLQQQSKTETPAAPVYKDRAAERRATYGPSDPIIFEEEDWRNSKRPRERISASTPEVTEEKLSATHVYEDASNPGNQLLRKMGWSEGDGLGRRGEGVKDPVGLDGSARVGVDN